VEVCLTDPTLEGQGLCLISDRTYRNIHFRGIARGLMPLALQKKYLQQPSFKSIIMLGLVRQENLHMMWGVPASSSHNLWRVALYFCQRRRRHCCITIKSQADAIARAALKRAYLSGNADAMPHLSPMLNAFTIPLRVMSVILQKNTLYPFATGHCRMEGCHCRKPLPAACGAGACTAWRRGLCAAASHCRHQAGIDCR